MNGPALASASARSAGVHKGRPASIDAAQVRAMKAQGLGGIRDREGPQDRAGVGLSGVGSRLTAAPLEGHRGMTRFVAREKTPVACEKASRQARIDRIRARLPHQAPASADCHLDLTAGEAQFLIVAC
jgi:hypothetical protein